MSMFARYILFVFLWWPILLFSQHKLTGKVVDSKTKEGLAFVNIVADESRLGATTGIDGRFVFNSDKPIKRLKLSYVGYEPQDIDVSGKKNIVIELKKTNYELTEFTVLPGENPAHRIIKNAVKNRKKNNPEKSLNFKYDSYSKLYFTAKLDSAILNNPEKFAALDSNDKEDLEWLEKHHIFLIETVTQRKYKLPDKSYEKIIASRTSGFKNPIFSLLATQLQSFSFYSPEISLMGKSYLNPISVNSTNKYLFLIEDTTFNGPDTVYIISYRPRKGKNFDGMKGLLYINTNGFAIQNVIAEPAEEVEDGFGISIQQKYERIEGSWFPTQLYSTIIMHNAQVEDYKMMGIGSTYLKNIEINPELKNKEFSYIDTEVEHDAHKKDDEFWAKYREDTLTQREKNTYHVMDSIGKAENLDRKLKGFESLLTGRLTWGLIDLDLNRFLRYNDYEGLRLGAGIHTNKRISKWFKVGGYGAYGFKDKEWKYGGDVDFLINYQRDIAFNFSAIKDVAEPGINEFYDYRVPMLSSAGNRMFYLSRMNNIDKIEGRLKFRTLRYLRVYLFANQENVAVTNNYHFKKVIGADRFLEDQYYTFTEVGAEFRYAFKEKVIETTGLRFVKTSKYPVLYARVQQGINAFNGEYTYTKFSMRAEKSFKIKGLGRPGFFVDAGYIDGQVPQHKLNASTGTFKYNNFMLASQNVFETMQPYEFFSSEYVHLHLRHSFGTLLLKWKKFAPEFVLTSSAGWGRLSYQGLHGGIPFKTMEKGYFESGMLVNNLIKLNNSAFGVGSFYRYGPYQLPKASDNFSVKMSLTYVF